MTYQVGQLTYSLFPAQANPGQLADNEVNHIVSMPAVEVINPGRALEVASDGVSVQQVQQTSSTLNIVGLSVLLTSREGTGQQNDSATLGGAAYNIGDMVAVLRRGAMFAEWSGTTQTAYGSPNVYHSSTTATNRGKLTDATPATGSGVEVTAAPLWLQLRAALPGTGNIALVEINAPGTAS